MAHSPPPLFWATLSMYVYMGGVGRECKARHTTRLPFQSISCHSFVITHSAQIPKRRCSVSRKRHGKCAVHAYMRAHKTFYRKHFLWSQYVLGPTFPLWLFRFILTQNTK